MRIIVTGKDRNILPLKWFNEQDNNRDQDDQSARETSFGRGEGPGSAWHITPVKSGAFIWPLKRLTLKPAGAGALLDRSLRQVG